MIVAVSPATDEARELIRELDMDIAALYPGLPINGIDAAEFESAGGYFVIAKEAGDAVGCGAFRPVDDRCAEIKRMFVRRPRDAGESPVKSFGRGDSPPRFSLDSAGDRV